MPDQQGDPEAGAWQDIRPGHDAYTAGRDFHYHAAGESRVAPSSGPVLVGPAKKSGVGKAASIAVAIAAFLIVVIGAGIGIWRLGLRGTQSAPHATVVSPMISEQHLLSELAPGDDYNRLEQIIGVDPDIKISFKSGDTLYQFNRQWEYIDLLVSAGRVLSVGVVAITEKFQPTLYDDGYPVKLNGPPIAQQVDGASTVGAIGNCATSGITYYYEGFPFGSPLAETSVVFGWDSTPKSTLVPAPVCSALSAAIECDQYDLISTNNLSLSYSDCLDNLGFGQEIRKLSPSAVILTAPGQKIIPEMLNLGYSTGLPRLGRRSGGQPRL